MASNAKRSLFWHAKTILMKVRRVKQKKMMHGAVAEVALAGR
jgi:hypothetical protein